MKINYIQNRTAYLRNGRGKMRIWMWVYIKVINNLKYNEKKHVIIIIILNFFQKLSVNILKYKQLIIPIIL